MSNVRGTVGMSVQLESVSRQTRYFQRQISASNTDWTTFGTDAWVPTMSGDFLLTVIWRNDPNDALVKFRSLKLEAAECRVPDSPFNCANQQTSTTTTAQSTTSTTVAATTTTADTTTTTSDSTTSTTDSTTTTAAATTANFGHHDFHHRLDVHQSCIHHHHGRLHDNNNLGRLDHTLHHRLDKGPSPRQVRPQESHETGGLHHLGHCELDDRGGVHYRV